MCGYAAVQVHISWCQDPRLFHTVEIVGMVASYRVLLSKLKISTASHARPGMAHHAHKA